jgi:hypothetical protein
LPRLYPEESSDPAGDHHLILWGHSHCLRGSSSIDKRGVIPDASTPYQEEIVKQCTVQ